MHLSKTIVYAFIFLIGASAGYIIRDRIIADSDTALDYVGIRGGESKYTHPLLDVLLPRDAPQNIGLRPFKGSIEKFIHEEIDKKWADSIAVYFRDLTNGPWFSIGETNEFYPGSLLKVPLMVAVLKQTETMPGILKQKIQYNRPDLQNTKNLTSKNLEFGRYYTVDDLLGRMIMYSDNVSTLLLLNFVNKDILEKTYIHLGIIESNAEHASLLDSSLPEYKLSITQYAAFFRILYNASYLSRELSEKALGLLAKDDFTSGLIAGVPSTIEVSHKWGYRELGDNGEVRQLHDCGIIYYPNAPYLLCIMTAGHSFETLDDAIKEISRVVYKEVDAQKQRAK